MLDYRVLGQLRVTRHADELHVGGPRQRRLLAVLLMHRNEVVSTDRLVEAVFAGDPTPTAAETLRTYVMRLRRVADDAVDAVRFEWLVAEGRARRATGDPVGAVSAFREALDLWSGDAYAEFDGEDWVQLEARRLAELRSVTEEQLVDAELECGLAAEVAAGGPIWDAVTGERLATMNGHGDVSDVAFSPDGETIATSGADGTVRLWSTESGIEQLALHGHDGPISSLAFDPDGDRLVSTSDGVARVWALDLDDLVGIAESRLTRSLTDDECRQYLHADACPA